MGIGHSGVGGLVGPGVVAALADYSNGTSTSGLAMGEGLGDALGPPLDLPCRAVPCLQLKTKRVVSIRHSVGVAIGNVYLHTCILVR